MYAFLCEGLEQEQTQLRQRLPDAKGKESLKIKLRLWVLEGVLVEGLAMDILNSIAGKYAKIELVPSHYFFPELYQGALIEVDAPQNYENLIVKK
mmetsp:Transcript_19819/g.24502  ORF Transcript_19819/g.24502 Transcript_19819/m.24502 type:complete len:95 (+) Transcript_19819:497-781(+)